mmetsp:Transcript_3348/g.6394  ORF Transcript_3348/g.6394 Transcript_3348/m.6394 type:complete len:685 (+) Transcript_3348:159-2213(+)
MKKGSIGIVKEAYSAWERRAPFTPSQVKTIVDRYGIEVVIQPSGKRVFSDALYKSAGARVSDDLSGCNAIFGVKQVPKENLIKDKTYLFFSHTIKGQLENMELLDTIREKNVRLIDYECITMKGIQGAPRLVAFGEYAGKAGMIDTLRGVGQQLLHQGLSTPLLSVGSAYMYSSYDEAARSVKDAGRRLVDGSRSGEPSRFNPLIFMFTGTGNVNRGARQVFDLMPHRMVEPEELHSFVAENSSDCPLIGCQVGLEDMVERISDGGFDKFEFYKNPEQYRSVFYEKYGRHCNVLVNGIYWDARYPRVVSKADIENDTQDERRLHFISDISCDIGGGIEILDKSTTIEEPFFTATSPKNATDIMLMGVDILPSELPREASQHFGDYLLPFVKGLASGLPTENLAPELVGACITEQGHLRERYEYIDKMRSEREREGTNSFDGSINELQLEGSTVLRLKGHLFDSGLINKMLDIVEAEDPLGKFHIVECMVGANKKSTVLLQITMDGGRAQLDDVLNRIRALAADSDYSDANAEIEEMPSSFCAGNYEATIGCATSKARAGHEKDAASHIEHDDPDIPFLVPTLQRVTVLGAGMVAKPCVEFLSRDTSRNVVVASGIAGEAQALCRKVGRSNLDPVLLNAGEETGRLEELIGSSDAVISLLPQPFHVPVAKLCVGKKSTNDYRQLC